MKREMENWGVSTHNVRVIHNGINVELFKPIPTIRKEYDLIWIGRYVPGKDAEFLINVIAELKKEMKTLKVLMIGSGPLKNSIEKKALNMDLGSTIHFIEKVSNDEIPLYLNKSRIFTLSSLEEGFPRTVLEAMACGLPVVCSYLPQLQDLVDDCGILVPTKDIAFFVNAVAKLLNDPDLAEKFGRNAHIKVHEKYSWDDTVNKTLQLYEEMRN
jgi:glycosyltransferase involved in cell wall biosynthesis